MSKIKIIIIRSILCTLTLGLLVNLATLYYLNIQKNAIIHDLEKDILIDKWWEICTSLLILFIPLVAVAAIYLTLIYSRKKEVITYYESARNDVTDFVPTLPQTSYGRRDKQTVTIADDFKKLFIPDFYKKDEIGINPFETMKEELEKGPWTITDLGRIARMCFEAKVQQPNYNHFNSWMREFCNKVGRTDCPKKPEKKSYRIAKESELLSTFLCIVRFGEKRFSDYKKRLSQ